MNHIGVEIPGISKDYPIYIGERMAGKLTNIIHDKKHSAAVVVTDNNVRALYEAQMDRLLSDTGIDYTIFSFCAGEGAKNAENLQRVLGACIEARLDRNGVVIAWGGGVVGDIAGFAASIFKRGIPYYQIPTTLLAQVDSSVGGKVGINHLGFKNILGAFYHPQAVLIDPAYLFTLSEREYKSGLAEVIKYALILDQHFLDYLIRYKVAIQNRDGLILQEIIATCCRLKQQIVITDERDAGIRAILNFGHTVGHALEYSLGPDRINHGEAVAIGMMLEAEISFLNGKLKRDSLNTLQNVIKSFELDQCFSNISVEDIMTGVLQDKKNLQEGVGLIYLTDIGSAERGWITAKELQDHVSSFFLR